KKPMMVAAACRREPFLAKCTPIAAKVTTIPQARVIQRAVAIVNSLELGRERLKRWIKSMQVAVLKEFNPEENTDIVAANKLANTSPASPDGNTFRTKCGSTILGSPVLATSSLSDVSNAAFSGA